MTYWTATAAQAKNLSTEQLGMLILRDLDDNYDVRENFTNIDAWRDAAVRAYRGDEGAQRAITEAVHWLRTKGFVMQHPSQSSACFVYVTKAGEDVLDNGIAGHQMRERLDVDVVRDLQPAKDLYLQGRFDTAAFEAMKAVEVAVRDAAQHPKDQQGSELLGVKLMRAALGKEGSLADPNVDGGEQVAAMELFSGAIGLFKNPSSHRYVDFDDEVLAAEVVILADLLLRLLARSA
jgi:uncharacterized protein (TIGR02391 family)